MPSLDGAPVIDTPQLSIVVPVYNEAPILDAHLALLTEWLDGRPERWELILVDDGSTDRSAEIIQQWVKRLEPVHAERLWPNRGVAGPRLRAGLRRARAGIVLTTEADLSWDFDCLAQLVHQIAANGVDVAVASPPPVGGRLDSVPAARVALSRYGNRLAGAVLGHGITMATGMTRAYRRAVLPRILSSLDGKEFHLDVLSRAIRAGLHVREIPATVAWRNPGARQRRFASGRKLATAIARHLTLLGRHAASAVFDLRTRS